MAVAAADFYTYARATGTPLPKTKQEEAKLAPAVNQWKNNQLRRENQGQEGINPGAVAGLTGLAGVGALALAATRGGLRQRVPEAVKPAFISTVIISSLSRANCNSPPSKSSFNNKDIDNFLGNFGGTVGCSSTCHV